MLDGIPFGGAGWVVGDGDAQSHATRTVAAEVLASKRHAVLHFCLRYQPG
jgi:hypothetical protein